MFPTDAAYACGIRFFDTAPVYGFGLSERRLGACLATYDRDAVVVSSKVGRLLEPLAEGESFRGLYADAPRLKPVFDFSRQAALPGGGEATVAFSLAYVTDGRMPEIAFFTCQQHAPQYFWKPEYQKVTLDRFVSAPLGDNGQSAHAHVAGFRLHGILRFFPLKGPVPFLRRHFMGDNEELQVQLDRKPRCQAMEQLADVRRVLPSKSHFSAKS